MKYEFILNHRSEHRVEKMCQVLNTRGVACGKHRVRRIMRELGLVVNFRREFKATTNSNHSHPVAENILGQGVEITRPNQVWATGITWVWTLEGWPYLAVVIDLYSRQVVGWAMGPRMKQQLVPDALNQAVKRRQPPRSLFHHSDHGS